MYVEWMKITAARARSTSVRVRNKHGAGPRGSRLRRWTNHWTVLCAAAALLHVGVALAATPVVGTKAPDFTLSTPEGKAVALSSELGSGDVVLVVLRGYPGYQCPYCQKQVHDFVDHAGAFAAKGARVLLVYPGPPGELDAHAKEFLAKEPALPANVTLVLDPDYAMTKLYSLRWEAEHETAYPATFVLGRDGGVRWEKVSHSHGDRTSAADVLDKVARQ